MQPGSRYPQLYEADRKGPAITREDFIKTAASLRAVLQMVQLSVSESDMDGEAEFKSGPHAQRRDRAPVVVAHRAAVPDRPTGRQGRPALDARFPVGRVHAGDDPGADRHRERLLCQRRGGKTLSAGLLVQDYKKQPIGRKGCWSCCSSLRTSSSGQGECSLQQLEVAAR